MEQDYSNLKGKTVFDFTDEKTAEEYALCPKVEHIRHLSTNQWRVANVLIRFATRTHNQSLLEAVKSQYADVIKKVFNE